ncbi:type II secretion system F family protein [Devosia beringensis]|uniref:type II secretion system F family protein n=1 Tax=Devosia beringensis TaxID=2657486 RepID=UPI00186B6493|nr:type II secretion system F family protein [Devosia beringensis]
MLGPIGIALLAMIVVAALGFALAPAALGGGRAQQRLKTFKGDVRVNRLEENAARNRDQRRKELQQTLKSQTAALNQKKRVTLKQLLFQAGMTIKPAAFVRNSVIFGTLVFLLLIVVQVPLYFAPIFAVAAGYLLPRMYVSRKRRKYQDRFLDELPNAVEAIVRGVKTGLPLNDSMRVVAKDAKEPVKSEFARVLDQQAVGMGMTDAVAVLLDRVPLPEVNFFVVVITVQQQAGGNLSEALSNLAKVLRNRKKMKQKIKAMSSEAKASAGIIGSLPFVVGILVSLTSPTYLAPLFMTPLGNVWLGIGIAMLCAGIFVMSKMVKFDY